MSTSERRAKPETDSIKGLLRHYVSCEDGDCVICSAVWADVSLPASCHAPSPPPSPRPRLRCSDEPLSSTTASESEDLGDAYSAAEQLHFFLYTLMVRHAPASAIVQHGKAIWQVMLGAPPPARGLRPTASAGRRLVQHRAACQRGGSCAVCGRALSFFARSSQQQQQQEASSGTSSGRSSSSSSSSYSSYSSRAAAVQAMGHEAAALSRELDTMLHSMAAQLEALRF